MLVAIGSAAAIYFSYDTKEVRDVTVKCAYGNRSTFLANHDKGIDISAYDDNKAVPQALNDDIIEACDITPEDIAQSQMDAKKTTASLREKNGCDDPNISNSTSFREIICTTSVSGRPYLVGSANVSENNIPTALLYVLIDLIVLAIIFDIGRRVFYYVVLGTLRPKG